MLGLYGVIFSVVVTCGIVADAFGADPLGGALQFGALGLCGLMIWQNNADRRALLKTLEAEQDRSAAAHEKLTKLHLETLDTIRKCERRAT